jgi:hypothetical protein
MQNEFPRRSKGERRRRRETEGSGGDKADRPVGKYAGRKAMGAAKSTAPLRMGLIDAFVNQLLDDGCIFKGADIAEVVLLSFGNFPEDAAHDFAAARFRKRVGKL